MELRIRGNDIELDGIKVARLFDIRTYQRQELESLFDKANNYQDYVDKAFNKGKEDAKNGKSGATKNRHF